MGLTFDEAIKKLEEHDITKLFNSHTIIEIVKQLRQEYAPTVEMTNEDKNTLYYYLENSTFFSLIERKHAIIEAEMLGITEGINEFLDLSDEDLMQAWLHPNDILIVDKE